MAASTRTAAKPAQPHLHHFLGLYPSYLAEYEFRFNRRKSRSRSLLFQRLLSAVVGSAPSFYWQILGRPDATTPLRAAA